jgi:RNA polymerase sigma-70 factor (ECF subfamily)
MVAFFTAMLADASNKEEFNALYERYKRKMYIVAYTILRDQQSAEDAVHDSLIKIIRNFEKYKQIPSNEVEGWIVIIVKNTARDFLKKSRRFEELNESQEIISVNDTEQNFCYRHLVSLIRSMPENYRTLLELKFVLEWSNIQIAKYFNTNENAVAAKLFRARKKLFRKLEKEGYTYHE